MEEIEGGGERDDGDAYPCDKNFFHIYLPLRISLPCIILTLNPINNLITRDVLVVEPGV